MRFIDKLQRLTRNGMDENTRKECKRVLSEIDLAARHGRYNTKFSIILYRENEDEIYECIIKMLNEKGLKAELEMHGYNMSHKRLNISWR